MIFGETLVDDLLSYRLVCRNRDRLICAQLRRRSDVSPFCFSWQIQHFTWEAEEQIQEVPFPFSAFELSLCSEPAKPTDTSGTEAEGKGIDADIDLDSDPEGPLSDYHIELASKSQGMTLDFVTF